MKLLPPAHTDKHQYKPLIRMRLLIPMYVITLCFMLVQSTWASDTNGLVQKIETESRRIDALQGQLQQEAAQYERNLVREQDKITHRIDRLEDRALDLLKWIPGLFVVFAGAGYLTIRQQVREHIRELVSKDQFEKALYLQVDKKLDARFEHLIELHRQIMEGLASFHAQDFESAYHAFRSIYEDMGDHDPFVSSHYAYLAGIVGDGRTARRLYEELLRDSKATKSDYYAKSAVNYANFLLKENARRSLDILQNALDKSETANGKAIIQLNFAAHLLLNSKIDSGLQQLRALEKTEEFARNPKIKLETYYYHIAYGAEDNRERCYEQLNAMFTRGDRSPYWSFEPHLAYSRKMMAERTRELEQLALKIRFGRRDEDERKMREARVTS